jgi:hypothetical protein
VKSIQRITYPSVIQKIRTSDPKTSTHLIFFETIRLFGSSREILIAKFLPLKYYFNDIEGDPNTVYSHFRAQTDDQKSR